MLTESIGPHWEMYFDGASRTLPAINGDPPRRKAGDRVVFVTPAKGVVYHSFSILKPDCSNKEAEYEALIFGLITALDMGIFYLYAYGDSQLVIRQIQGIYEVRKPELVPYHALVLKLMERFAFIEVHHVPRRRNAEADALAKLAAALTLPSEGEADVRVEQRLLLPPMLDIVSDQLQATQAECSPVEHPDWRLPFIEYLKHGRLPDGPAKRIELRRRLPLYLLHNDILYRKSILRADLAPLSVGARGTESYGRSTFWGLRSAPIRAQNVPQAQGHGILLAENDQALHRIRQELDSHLCSSRPVFVEGETDFQGC